MQTDALVIRQLTPNDAVAYRAIRLESLQVDPNCFGSTYEEDAAKPLAHFERALEPDDAADQFHGAFGGFAGADLAGIAGFYRQSAASERLRHKGTLCAMYVRDDLRGSGLAKDLVEAVCNFASGKVELIQLCVMGNNPRARCFYENCGFVAYGVEPQAIKIVDDYLDEVLMWRAIAPCPLAL